SHLRCDDDTMPADNPMTVYMNATWAALEKTKQAYKPLSIRDEMEKAGFVNITVKRRKFPMGSWPKDKLLKEIGKWGKILMSTGLESYGLGLLTRGLGLDTDEAIKLIEDASNEARCNA